MGINYEGLTEALLLQPDCMQPYCTGARHSNHRQLSRNWFFNKKIQDKTPRSPYRIFAARY